MRPFGSSVAVIGLFLALPPGMLHASAIGRGAFGPGATIESFEGLAPSPNAPLMAGGFTKPGLYEPFVFGSGITLTNPLPNNHLGAVGILLGDWSIGPAYFGLAENGAIASAADVPDGTAYIALDSLSTPIEFTLPTDAYRVGAFVTAAQGSIGLMAFDDNGDLIPQEAFISAVDVSDWGTNFLGLATTVPFHKVWFRNSQLGGYMVLDGLVVETVPEPNYLLTLLSG